MLTIGKLGAMARVKVPTIRYYEQIGLLPNPPRTDGMQRRYGADEIKHFQTGVDKIIVSGALRAAAGSTLMSS